MFNLIIYCLLEKGMEKEEKLLAYTLEPEIWNPKFN